MTNNDYQQSITTSASPAAAYRALTREHSQWWTACEGEFNQPGDRIRFGFPPQESFWTMEATSLIPDRRVELVCVEAHHIILDDPAASKTEWLGTHIRWDIEQQDDQTLIRMTHAGLTSELACYEICRLGWEHFFTGSLARFLETGVGTPH